MKRILLAAVAAVLPFQGMAQTPVPVVASFSILGDMVAEVGGDRVAVTTLVGPDGDAHVYQPTPAAAEQIATAKLVVVNGLGFEGWIDRLVTAAGYKGRVAVATEGVTPRHFEEGEDEDGHDEAADHVEGADHAEAAGQEHDHGALDPHAWQDMANARTYVANIAAALSAVDPEGAATYAANAKAYTARITAAETELRALLSSVPPERRIIVTSHDALGYFGEAYGLRIEAPQGLSTDSEASAADVGRLIQQIRAEHVPAVFLENITDPRLLNQISSETGAAIGGTLYSDALSDPAGPAATYIDMMLNNARRLSAALS